MRHSAQIHAFDSSLRCLILMLTSEPSPLLSSPQVSSSVSNIHAPCGLQCVPDGRPAGRLPWGRLLLGAAGGHQLPAPRAAHGGGQLHRHPGGAWEPPLPGDVQAGWVEWRGAERSGDAQMGPCDAAAHRQQIHLLLAHSLHLGPCFVVWL